jgi:hypothetical protein
MDDPITHILELANTAAEDINLRQYVSSHIERVRASRGRGDRQLVARAERAVAAKPEEAFRFDSAGRATLNSPAGTWSAGRFETPTIGDLRSRAVIQRPDLSARTATARLWVFDGGSPFTDIGSLQATAAPRTLFQVASQFNCLESPGPYVTPVESYLHDPTQGPRAAVSAFPATLLRHYSAPAPNGERFTQQTDGQQIDLLADALGAGHSRNGYFTGAGADSRSLVATLEERFDFLRVGVHDDAQVVLGYDWDGAVEDSAGRRIAQVFTSTVAGGGYGGEVHLGDRFRDVSRHLLRAAYLGTLLAAVSLARTRVVLTLIGGGVFRNDPHTIWQAILRALDEVGPLLSANLDVIVNGYSLGSQLNIEEDVLPDVRERGGAVFVFSGEGLRRIVR